MLENRKDIRLNIAKNIKRFREMNNLTQKQLAEKLNVKNSAVSNWESNANSPDIEKLFEMCEIFNVSINDMYGMQNSTCNLTHEEYEHIETCRKLSAAGQAYIRNMTNNLIEYENVIKEEIQSFDEQVAAIEKETIKIYWSKAAAGIPLPIVSNDYDEIEKIDDIPAEADFGIILSGDSMEPDYPDGCTVWIKSTPELEDGDIGVFLLNGEATCKKLYCQNGECKLISLNQKYRPIIINEYTDMRIIGKVVGHSK